MAGVTFKKRKSFRKCNSRGKEEFALNMVKERSQEVRALRNEERGEES